MVNSSNEKMLSNINMHIERYLELVVYILQGPHGQLDCCPPKCFHSFHSRLNFAQIILTFSPTTSDSLISSFTKLTSSIINHQSPNSQSSIINHHPSSITTTSPQSPPSFPSPQQPTSMIQSPPNTKLDHTMSNLDDENNILDEIQDEPLGGDFSEAVDVLMGHAPKHESTDGFDEDDDIDDMMLADTPMYQSTQPPPPSPPPPPIIQTNTLFSKKNFFQNSQTGYDDATPFFFNHN
eukprot:TRINITY_DN1182_c0_g1_i5.p1 TRINITY_DN1182_c0_g1~~TRINITY_DN1182_c0_g1_i5.p1  ORF type:complete len:237 (+),score=45.67 TRINITY_DN1182_c0_g1_i5:173-883(+)